MSRPDRYDAWQTRQEVLQLAVRLVADEGINSLRAARRKAAERLRATRPGCLPELAEIQAAVADYLRLFEGPEHTQRLATQRRAALQAMHALQVFDPRLTGPALHGTATDHTPVTLHLFTDTAEEVGFSLMERGIPFELGERKARFTDGRESAKPCYEFYAGDTNIELVVFNTKEARHAPASPIDGKPMRRVRHPAVASLLEDR